MAITILPALPSDSATLTPIGLLAFANDPLNAAMVKASTSTPSQLDEHLQWRIKRNERRMQGAGKFWFKAVDSETGEMIGYTGILAPEAGVKFNNVAVGAGSVEAEGGMPEIIDREWLVVWEGIMEELKERHLKGRDDYWYVCSMVVHPKHQGRGIGRQLLEAICELADEAGQDIYLEASAPGKPLYEKGGFDVLEEKVLLDGTARLTAMLRRPRSL
ncbi:hypothetical protein Q7P37_005187 [Cladosporium fusiforme]